jgi:beta-lactam-binding protein with PASTA domain
VPSIGRSTSLAFLVALALVAAGCADGGSERLVVPEVTGDQAGYQRVLGAYDLLRQAGFVVEITRDFRLSSEWPLGQVAQQWPRGGVHARRGSTVELTVSEGRQWFAGSGVGLPPIRDWNRERPLPSLVGMRVSEAADWLERHELGWDARLPALPATNRRKLLDTYIVTAQSPGAGHQVGINYTVQLDARVTDGVLAAWKEPRVRVPYVAGEDLFGAYKRLQARGLRVETDSRLTMSSYQSAGVVAGQQPPAGGTVPRRTIVTLRLARERLVVDRLTSPYESGHVRMRELVGKSLGAAAKWLAANNLYWELLDAPALPPTSRPDLLDAYVVSAQRPRPGTRLPQLTQSKFGKPAVAGALPIQLRAELRSD